jgi:CBS domain-containing protein
MNEKSIVRIEHVMKNRFDVVDGMTTVSEALNKMKHVETKCLVVDKRHDDDEYGIVLLSDIARNVLAVDRSPERVNIYEIMSKPVVCVDAEMDIRYCARLFDKFGLSRAPVLKNGRLAGVVSYTDMVIRGMMDNHESTY